MSYEYYTPTDTVCIQFFGEYHYHSIECARLIELLTAGRNFLQAQLTAERYDEDNESDQEEYRDRLQTIAKADELLAYFMPVPIPDEDGLEY